jgi:hypothetical protein
MSKLVYTFGNGAAEGAAKDKNLLGGKGANLAEMNLIGIPVPAGFTVTTEVCTYYYDNNNSYPADLDEQVRDGISHIEKVMGKKFADKTNPLLVSVRSGARVSMPGMMNTVLNLGLNDETVLALAKASNDERFAYDSYRRFIMMFYGRAGRGYRLVRACFGAHEGRKRIQVRQRTDRRRLKRTGRKVQGNRQKYRERISAGSMGSAESRNRRGIRQLDV